MMGPEQQVRTGWVDSVLLAELLQEAACNSQGCREGSHLHIHPPTSYPLQSSLCCQSLGCLFSLKALL